MPKRDPLRDYRAKRRPGKTPEPGVVVQTPPSPGGPEAGVFVVHLHAARRLHYDLRLEVGGALASWAVPKGPALDPAEKRLAVHVEDHPLEYADFEGVIPEGNYGAGAIVLWDRGVWLPLEDPREGLERGKLLFELRGFKLRGVWTLVRLAKSEREWLLIRERRHMPPEEAKEPPALETLPAESVLSGLTVEGLAEGGGPAAELESALSELGAPRRRVSARRVRLMLAEPRDEPFSAPGWIFEPKLDGYRMLAERSGSGPLLLTRGGHDASAAFPELARAVEGLPVGDFVLDGEVVVHDAEGLPSFSRLQGRAALRREAEARRAAFLQPAVFYAFDLLGLLGRDVRGLPLRARRTLLRRLLPPVGWLRFVEGFEERGEELYERTRALGLEGIVGKKADSPYRGRRSPDWVKIRARRTADLVVVGWTSPRGARTGFGALHLAGWHEGQLVYAGRVGSGFSEREIASLLPELERLDRPSPPCVGAVPEGAGHRWVTPSVSCEVEYLEWTPDGLLRQPVFVRLRPDKPPGECHLPRGATRPAAEARLEEALEPGVTASAEDGPVVLTNPEKVFWPREGYTKRDLFEYYRRIAPWALPYLRGRPLVLTRYPDGIEGKSFYQKNAPPFTPGWVRTVKISHSEGEKEIEYFVCDDEASLLFVANMGAIPLHVWASRCDDLERPDWCILDLDPKGAPFSNVVEIARHIHKLCRQIELPAFAKTSGASGLHVLIPLGRQVDYEGSRTLAELLARLTVAALPEIATVERGLEAREGRVYVDFLQNRRGQLLVTPFSLRPLPGAPVSMPLRWREVGVRLDPARHTIRSAPRRMARMGEDPVRPLLELTPDLAGALERLRERSL